MTEVLIGGRSFEEIVRLLKDDPEAFERFRKKQLEAEIARAPEAQQPRLRAICNGIELRLASFKGNDLARFNAAAADFYSGLNRFNATLNGPCKKSSDAPPRSAKIVLFRNKHRQ